MRLEFDAPHPEMMVKLATWHGGDWEMLKPKHYLSNWHLDYNDQANEVAKEEGHESWQQAFTDHFFWKPSTDIELPVIQAWRFTEITPTVRVFERNPYYLRVDTAGNQLPYIDRIVSTVVEKEVYTLKIIGGEADLAYGSTSLENFALYKENEAAGDYKVTLIPGLSAAEVGVVLNQNHLDEWKAELYQDVRFRRALSLAINRDEVNEQVFFGLSTPRQAAAGGRAVGAQLLPGRMGQRVGRLRPGPGQRPARRGRHDRPRAGRVPARAGRRGSAGPDRVLREHSGPGDGADQGVLGGGRRQGAAQGGDRPVAQRHPNAERA